jgi:hypothetical protein
MNKLKLAALAALLVFGAATAQEVEEKMQLKVVVGGDEATEVNWTSSEMDFDMQDLAIGESRTFENDSGNPVTITRAEEGFSFDIDGKTVMMPDLGAHGTHMAFADASGIHGAVDIDMDSDVHVMTAHHPEGVTIVSGQPLDQSVKDSIRSVLISAGNNEEVTFIDGSEDGRRVMVRKIKITN